MYPITTEPKVAQARRFTPNGRSCCGAPAHVFYKCARDGAAHDATDRERDIAVLRQGHSRVTWGLALAGLVALALAGCGSGTVVVSTPTPTATATVVVYPPTPAPTATLTLVSDTQFACPVTVSGSQKLFADAETGLRFSFPASLTEEHCERRVIGDGSETLFIGNLFNLGVVPRPAGLTIQQWVNQKIDQYEVVTLTPLTVAHAESAVSIKVEPAATPGPRPFDAEPFNQSDAIVAGTQHFYVVGHFIAEMNTTDSAGLDGSIIATFDVP
jgi:hypothetical protein